MKKAVWPAMAMVFLGLFSCAAAPGGGPDGFGPSSGSSSSVSSVNGSSVSSASSGPVSSGNNSSAFNRMQVISGFHSAVLNNDRCLRVYLPESYSNGSAQYPVLYMHDGQNIFRPGGTYGCWCVEDAYNALAAAGLIHEAIIVGIDNTANRTYEYNLGNGGIVSNYLDFVAGEVMPYINSHYRTLTGPSNTAVMGSSFGGNASLYMAWTRPDVFGMAGCMSSALWWDNFHLRGDVLGYSGPRKPLRIWLDAGDGEFNDDSDGNGMSSYGEWSYDLANRLVEKGWSNTADIFLDIIQGGQHNEASWAKNVFKPILFFFGKDRGFHATNLALGLSRTASDTRNSVSNIMILPRAYYDNGLSALVPLSLLGVTSPQTALFTLTDLRLNLVTNLLFAQTQICITASYSDFSNTAVLQVLASVNVPVAFEFATPDNSGAFIYLTGGTAELGSWNVASGVKLYLKSSSGGTKTYTNTVALCSFTAPQFKVCAGPGWQYEELDGSGNPPGNRSLAIGGAGTNYSGAVARWRAVP